ncbi:thiol:disulfide interchange protein DsbA [Pseudoduganella flava]|uniref:Thiol:disulfide interchange protein n=2 Tax=Pseudoduganella flava TaxID=871742 RepID=A0A562Q4N4_9BURK|nr:thiol:disulfide interchange protein DsbA/DsbL [Pseudoduganella flava]TWI51717.1 thiol:disulfide interchange protein DsbA [Pseudoduganella flava]
MRFLRLMLAATALLGFTATSQAAAPGYQTLSTPVPVTAQGKKVEVIEFFMYTCPHCYALDPLLEEWVKKQGDKIVFRRLHFAQGPTDPLAHAYVTLEAMGQTELVHTKILRAIHGERQRIYRSDDDLKAFLFKNGIDKARYEQSFNSFGVQTKMKQLPGLITKYQVTSAPTLVVDGRYMTSPSLAGSPGTSEAQAGRDTIAVLDQLVAKAAAEKK